MQSVREATLALINELGPDGVTTAKIAARAGISPGSLYRYYPNKQAIFTDIYHVELTALDQRLMEESKNDWSTATLEEAIRKTSQLTHRFYKELLSVHGGFFASHYRQLDFTQREIPGGEQSWRHTGQQWLVAILERDRERLQITDPEFSAGFIMDLATGYYHRLIEVNPEGIEDERVCEELSELFLRYLVVE